ncbi:DUF1934 domain-containing protein [Caloranaerobacter azorensis]|uniref:DUF1934 domain-containing protein n=1 Tax=Caloranaerobacter azorensis TaxID=116090 RepID=A0A6P1YHP2_9FIRM|nr:DUF1934 domain-containing protein [Caloranaerobacter azorensis]QIB27725.1 DUF1934 domain-containing protein [Caloranaerobacter azorensis]
MKDVVLKIKGIQKNLDGEDNTIELITEGKFYKKNGAYYLVYEESEISGMEGSTTTLRIQDDKILMKRFGTSNSKLIFEKNKRHKTSYHTQFGDFDMEVMTNKIEVDISDLGKGSIKLSYRLVISNAVESNNQLTIDIS